MRTDEFDFHLPEERIALEPARPRDAARLLYVSGKGIHDHTIRNLPTLLMPGDLLVINRTKVIPAQLTALRRARAHGGGGDVSIDITLHQKVGSDTDHVAWRAFLRPAKRVTDGDVLYFPDGQEAIVRSRQGAEVVLAFPGSEDDFASLLRRVGKPPLPPYIARKRGILPRDEEDYQTTFAQEEGSVAAPTAGLHFTPQLIESLRQKEIAIAPVILHVGAGTFLPVTAGDIGDHKMHSEWGAIPPETATAISRTRAIGGRVVCVGTTSLRLLETAARGAEPASGFPAWEGETDIFITPGFEFRVTDLLMTNFHLPRSTLFMLVCAFAGIDRMKAVYQHAIMSGYRFYSYGDACLLERAGMSCGAGPERTSRRA